MQGTMWTDFFCWPVDESVHDPRNDSEVAKTTVVWGYGADEEAKINPPTGTQEGVKMELKEMKNK